MKKKKKKKQWTELPPVQEVPLMGLKQIAEYLHICVDTLCRRYLEEMVEAGVVLPRSDIPGNAKKMVPTTRWFSWPSLVQRWVISRGGLGQHLGNQCIRKPQFVRLLRAAGFRQYADIQRERREKRRKKSGT